MVYYDITLLNFLNSIKMEANNLRNGSIHVYRENNCYPAFIVYNRINKCMSLLYNYHFPFLLMTNYCIYCMVKQKVYILCQRSQIVHTYLRRSSLID